MNKAPRYPKGWQRWQLRYAAPAFLDHKARAPRTKMRLAYVLLGFPRRAQPALRPARVWLLAYPSQEGLSEESPGARCSAAALGLVLGVECLPVRVACLMVRPLRTLLCSLSPLATTPGLVRLLGRPKWLGIWGLCWIGILAYYSPPTTGCLLL